MNIKNKIGKLVYKDIGVLQEFQGQLKELSTASFEKLKTSFERHGNIAPVFIWKNNILDGHQRIKTLLEIKKGGGRIPEKIPCIEIKAENKKQAKRFLLQYVSQQGVVTEDGLYEFLHEAGLDKDLETLKQELVIPGLDMEEFDAGFFRDDSGEGDDEVPEAPKKARSKAGDLYEIGEHRVLCGDATDGDVLDRLMNGKKANMIFTDPPYNVDYEGSAGKIKNDNMKDDEFFKLLSGAFAWMYAALVDGGGVYVAHADTEGLNFRLAFKEAGFYLASCLIWRKNALVLGRADYHWMHEPILYGWKPTGSHSFYGGRNKTTIHELLDEGLFMQSGKNEYQFTLGDSTFIISGPKIQVEEVVSTVVLEEKPKRNDLHPTMKPISLITRFLLNSSKSRQLVLDSFLGSVSTLIACEKAKRSCYGLELDPVFVDVIIQRYVDYTGDKNVRLNGKKIKW